MRSRHALFGASAVVLSAALWACGSSSKATTSGTGGKGASSGSGSASTAASSSSSAASGSAASSSSTGAGGSIGDAGSDASVPINPDAFYVATTGDDANPGTFAMPFLTLAQAQKAMRQSSTVKTSYVRAGTYEPPRTGGTCVWGDASGSSIELTSADQGETWSFYPPDGYGSAVLDGQSTVGNSGGTGGGNGVGCAFAASQVSDVTIVGLQMRSYLYASVWAYAAPDLKVQANEVHDTRSASFSTGAIYLIASPGATVANNYVHDNAYMGIIVSDNSATADQMSNSTVSGNVVVDACTWPAVSGGGNDENGGDCGGIYLWSQHPSVSTHVLVENNYVRDVNPASKGAGDFGSCCAQGIYLDDGMNAATVRGNVVTGITSACFQIHGGQNNVIQGNVCDLGASGKQAIVEYQNDMLTQMTGNVFEDNVVVAGSAGAGSGFVGSNTPPNPMTIKNNAYFNYVGSAVGSTSTGGAGSDANPTYVNPGISCWAPTLTGASPAKGPPVSFPGITGGWGWPGFVIPQTGTAPSWPHGC